jgi:(+)-pinoresinol hydroxylase
MSIGMKLRGSARFLAVLALSLSSALALVGVANAAEPSLTPQQQQGKRLYNHICVYCHSPGVWGTNRLSKRMDKEHAVLENRTDLSAGAIQTIVRTGIGSMPPLRKSELTDADVSAIAAYLTRQNR